MGMKAGLVGVAAGIVVSLYTAYPMYINYYNLSGMFSNYVQLAFYEYLAAVLAGGVWGIFLLPFLQAQLIQWLQWAWMLNFAITNSKDAFCINFVIIEAVIGGILYAVCAKTKHKDAKDFFAGITVTSIIVIVVLTVIFDTLIGTTIL